MKTAALSPTPRATAITTIATARTKGTKSQGSYSRMGAVPRPTAGRSPRKPRPPPKRGRGPRRTRVGTSGGGRCGSRGSGRGRSLARRRARTAAKRRLLAAGGPGRTTATTGGAGPTRVNSNNQRIQKKMGRTVVVIIKILTSQRKSQIRGIGEKK